jgi:hypothetical protein
MPIDNGVLQSVLTWGPSCAPDPAKSKPPNPYSTWWISSQYVNTVGYYSGFTGCLGGPIMPVDVGHTLAIDFSLFKSVWTETVLDLQSAKRQNVSFHISLAGQAQAIAYFRIEPKDGASPPEDVTFRETTISFAFPDKQQNCAWTMKGSDDRDPPPLKWSDLSYVFDSQEGHNGKEALQS